MLKGNMDSVEGLKERVGRAKTSYEYVQPAFRMLAQTLQLSYHRKRQAAPQGGSVGYRDVRRLFGLWPGISVRLGQNEKAHDRDQAPNCQSRACDCLVRP